MTIACALIHDGETWLGSDRQTTLGDRERALGAPKWCIRSDRGAAAVTSGQGAYGAILRRHAEWLLKLDVNEFWVAFTNDIKASGHGPKINEDGVAEYAMDVLCVHPGYIWHISGVGCIRLVGEPYYASGSGDPYALGAFLALRSYDLGLTGENIVQSAVEAAIRYDIRCGGEPWVEKL